MLSTAEIELKLENVKNVVERVDLLNQLSYNIHKKNLFEALDISSESETLSKSVDYSAGLAISLFNSGIYLRLLLRFDDSITCFKRAYGIYISEQNLHGQCKILNSISNVYVEMGDHSSALRYLILAFDIAKNIEDRELKEIIYSNLGRLYLETGDNQSALEFFTKVMELYSSGETEIPDTFLNNIGIIFSNIGDKETGLEYFRMSMESSEKHGNKLAVGSALINLGVTYAEMKKFDDALHYLDKALMIYEDAGFIPGQINALSSIAGAYFKMEDYEKVLELYMQVLELRRSTCDHGGIYKNYCDIGEVYCKLKKYTEAIAKFTLSLEGSRILSNKTIETSSLIGLGNAAFEIGKTDVTLDCYKEALKLAKERNALSDEKKIYKLIYEHYKKTGNFRKALEYLEMHNDVSAELEKVENNQKLTSLLTKYRNGINNGKS